MLEPGSCWISHRRDRGDVISSSNRVRVWNLGAVKVQGWIGWLGKLKEAAIWTKSGHQIPANLGQILGEFVACLKCLLWSIYWISKMGHSVKQKQKKYILWGGGPPTLPLSPTTNNYKI